MDIKEALRVKTEIEKSAILEELSAATDVDAIKSIAERNELDIDAEVTYQQLCAITGGFSCGTAELSKLITGENELPIITF